MEGEEIDALLRGILDERQRKRMIGADHSVRWFDGPIFMGNGTYSGTLSQLLHDRLDHALSLMSGLQQGAEDPNADLEIENVALDVVAALGLDGQLVMRSPLERLASIHEEKTK